MAANNRGTIITTRGLQLVTKLTSSRVQMKFSSVKVGTGSPPSGTDPSELTQLVTYKMDGTIAEYGYDEEVKDAYVVMQLMNTGIESGFVMTEIGLYAIDPDLGEILYAYVDLSDDPNHILPAENGRSKTVQIKLHVIVGEVTEITATINPLSQITRAEFDKEIGKKLDSQGGDIADTVVSAFDISMDSFPVPKAGEKPRTLWGKMKKFTEDVKNWKTGVCLIGQIVNNCVTSRADLPLSAAQGKALMDQLTVLNTNFPQGMIARTNSQNTYEARISAGADGYLFIDSRDIASGGITRLQFGGNQIQLGIIRDGAWNLIANIRTDMDIQSGSVSVLPVHGEVVEFSVTFPRAFLKAPQVVVCPYTIGPQYNSVSVGEATKTGFTGYLYRNVLTTANMIIRWIAVA